MAARIAIGREPVLTRFEFAQPHMGTLFRIVLYAPDEATARTASTAAFDRIAKLDDSMSDYRAESELMALCRQAGGPPLRVSEDLFRVLARAQEFVRLSNGAFDATIGPLSWLWRRARRRHEVPDAESIAHARGLVDYRELVLDSKARTAQLRKRGMLLDLGGIAKGYAADAALAILKEQGIERALIAAGGDIAAGRPPPEKPGWRVAIAPLDSPGDFPGRTIWLSDAAVSTSGDAEQHLEIGGVRYSHIIDPKTGLALQGRSSVTVMAPDATASDALATAVSVLGPERGLELINSLPGTGLLFIQETRQGHRTVESGLAHAAGTR